MPVAQTDLLGDAIRTPVNAFLGAELGRLRTVTAFLTSVASPQPSNRVEIGVCTSGPLPTSRVCVLATGYVQQNTAVHWSGDLPLEKTWRVYITLQSSDNASVRLAIVTSRD